MSIVRKRRRWTFFQRLLKMASVVSPPGTPLFSALTSFTDTGRKRNILDTERQPRTCQASVFVVLVTGALAVAICGCVLLLLDRRSRTIVGTNANVLLSNKSHYNNLVMVAGHAVFIGLNTSSYLAPEDWFLQSYQLHPGIIETFVEHIKMGVEATAADPNALLVFSGGYTRTEAGSRSESGSYWMLADGANWFGHPNVKESAVVEDRARDSYENLLFSICRFRQYTGVYPKKITVVSYELKRHRFIHLHAASLGFDESQVTFLGNAVLNPVDAEKGELETVRAFENDPYGCKDPIKSKRAERDPFGFGGDVGVHSCPALKPFLSGCPSSRYTGNLPWRMSKRLEMFATNI